jgi:hypothetical protein
VDLVSFAAKLKPACFVCGITERDEIETAWGNGVRAAAVIAWLIDVRKYEAADVPDRKKIEQHFEGNHNKRGAR